MSSRERESSSFAVVLRDTSEGKGEMSTLTVPMHPLPHDNVLLLVLHVLQRVGESADLPLDGSGLAVVGDVDNSVDVEPIIESEGREGNGKSASS